MRQGTGLLDYVSWENSTPTFGDLLLVISKVSEDWRSPYCNDDKLGLIKNFKCVLSG